MRQLTLRGFGEEVDRVLRRVAETEGISLNQAALRLLRSGAGLGAPAGEPRDRVGSSLDALAGTWSEEEESEFLRSIQPLEGIDESLWK